MTNVLSKDDIDELLDGKVSCNNTTVNKSKWLEILESNNGRLSSGRIINLIGMIVMSALIVYDTIQNNKLDSGLLTVFAMYSAGSYGASKYLDKQKSSEKEY